MEFVNLYGLDKDREDFTRTINKRAGKGNWFWVFKVGKRLYSYDMGMQLYEDAYWLYLRQDIKRVKYLVGQFDVIVNDCYDRDASLNYSKQAHKWREHYADIAVRRCLRRLGVWFKGKDLLNITKTEFDDQSVPFHMPHLISGTNKSARSWLYKNRMIVIVKEVEDKCQLAEHLVR